MPTRPRDLTVPAWQQGATDQHIERIIVAGGRAVGRSPLMPGFPELRADPGLRAGIVDLIRSFSR